MYSNRKAL